MSSARPPAGAASGQHSSRSHHPSSRVDARRGAQKESQTLTLGEQHGVLQERAKGNFICRMKFSNDVPDIPFDPVGFTISFQTKFCVISHLACCCLVAKAFTLLFEPAEQIPA
jgi:hypothetical protein